MILADKAFAMNEYTIKPFEGNPEVSSLERVFNYRLSRGRRVVENAFGILSAVFRVLRKSMALHPEIASKIVLTMYLHNFLRKRPACLIEMNHLLTLLSGIPVLSGSTFPLIPFKFHRQVPNFMNIFINDIIFIVLSHRWYSFYIVL